MTAHDQVSWELLPSNSLEILPEDEFFRDIENRIKTHVETIVGKLNNAGFFVENEQVNVQKKLFLFLAQPAFQFLFNHLKEQNCNLEWEELHAWCGFYLRMKGLDDLQSTSSLHCENMSFERFKEISSQLVLNSDEFAKFEQVCFSTSAKLFLDECTTIHFESSILDHCNRRQLAVYSDATLNATLMSHLYDAKQTEMVVKGLTTALTNESGTDSWDGIIATADSNHSLLANVWMHHKIKFMMKLPLDTNTVLRNLNPFHLNGNVSKRSDFHMDVNGAYQYKVATTSSTNKDSITAHATVEVNNTGSAFRFTEYGDIPMIRGNSIVLRRPNIALSNHDDEEEVVLFDQTDCTHEVLSQRKRQMEQKLEQSVVPLSMETFDVTGDLMQQFTLTAEAGTAIASQNDETKHLLNDFTTDLELDFQEFDLQDSNNWMNPNDVQFTDEMDESYRMLCKEVEEKSGPPFGMASISQFNHVVEDVDMDSPIESKNFDPADFDIDYDNSFVRDESKMEYDEFKSSYHDDELNSTFGKEKLENSVANDFKAYFGSTAFDEEFKSNIGDDVSNGMFDLRTSKDNRYVHQESDDLMCDVKTFTEKSLFNSLVHAWFEGKHSTLNNDVPAVDISRRNRNSLSKEMVKKRIEKVECLQCVEKVFQIGVVAMKEQPHISVCTDGIAVIRTRNGQHVHASLLFHQDGSQKLDTIRNNSGVFFTCTFGDDMFYKVVPKHLRGHILHHAMVFGNNHVLYAPGNLDDVSFCVLVSVIHGQKRMYAKSLKEFEHLSSWAFKETIPMECPFDVSAQDWQVANDHIALWKGLHRFISQNGPAALDSLEPAPVAAYNGLVHRNTNTFDHGQKLAKTIYSLFGEPVVALFNVLDRLTNNSYVAHYLLRSNISPNSWNGTEQFVKECNGIASLQQFEVELSNCLLGIQENSTNASELNVLSKEELTNLILSDPTLLQKAQNMVKRKDSEESQHLLNKAQPRPILPRPNSERIKKAKKQQGRTNMYHQSGPYQSRQVTGMPHLSRPQPGQPRPCPPWMSSKTHGSTSVPRPSFGPPSSANKLSAQPRPIQPRPFTNASTDHKNASLFPRPFMPRGIHALRGQNRNKPRPAMEVAKKEEDKDDFVVPKRNRLKFFTHGRGKHRRLDRTEIHTPAQNTPKANGRKLRTCTLCRKETTYCCTQCKVPLCTRGRGNIPVCFNVFHQMEDLPTDYEAFKHMHPSNQNKI